MLAFLCMWLTELVFLQGLGYLHTKGKMHRDIKVRLLELGCIFAALRRFLPAHAKSVCQFWDSWEVFFSSQRGAKRTERGLPKQ